ncbi:MAG: cell division protein FtsQ [Prevotella sp.]|nr:cell division protein FtsQ [Prevotella sp.]
MSINWKKTAIIALDVVIAVYLVLAVTAFNQPDDRAAICSAVNIDITEATATGFLGPVEVRRLLERNNLYPLAQPMQFISTRQIEETLEKSPFIENAECYKTQGGHICISLDQCLPVMRIMADNGDNYYLDDKGDILPSSHFTSDLIVATGHITRSYAQRQLAPIARQLMDNRFWQSQIEQLHVLADGSLELIPRVGDHVVYLGTPSRIPLKLERLRKFYQYGLTHAGWNRYERISVEFDNQIICTKRKKTKPKTRETQDNS